MKYFKVILYFITFFLITTTLFGETVKQKKDHFREVVVPAVKDIHDELFTQYIEIEHYIDAKSHKVKIQKLKAIYNVKTDKELLVALKPAPMSIAIAQAALESAWATSRFYREANNIFGIWSFNKNEPRIAAGKKRGKTTIWLRKYKNIRGSIRDYYKILATKSAFKSFRALNMRVDNPYRLVKKLNRYSELGAKYGVELTSVIKYNKFYLYDKEKYS